MRALLFLPPAPEVTGCYSADSSIYPELPIRLAVKLQLIFLLFMSVSAFAECEDYTFQGNIRLHDKAFFIHINEGTLSEIQIQISKSEELKFLPYHDEVAYGKFEDGTYTNIDFAVPDGKEFKECKK